MTTYILNLSSAAKKNGADKYSANLGDDKPSIIYIPQVISRKNSSKPLEEIAVIISEKEIDNSFKIILSRVAKSNGGDMYYGIIEEQEFTPYLPQVISRKNKEIIEEFYINFVHYKIVNKQNEILKWIEDIISLAGDELVNKFIEEINNYDFIDYMRSVVKNK